uniref:MARVEL domain-containing protein n=1 Tax=Cacopsylla melanoneura TaxID=428564 RepID=A0A8D8M9P4_9HEMI
MCLKEFQELGRSLVGSPVFVAKITEIILSLLSIVWIVGSLYPSYHSIFYSEIVYATWYGFLFINIFSLVGYFLSEPLSKKLAVVISLIGAIFHLISAFILIDTWSDIGYRRHLASAVFTVINFVMFVLDTAFFWKYGGNYSM